jgi:hypothetical protein
LFDCSLSQNFSNYLSLFDFISFIFSIFQLHFLGLYFPFGKAQSLAQSFKAHQFSKSKVCKEQAKLKRKVEARYCVISQLSECLCVDNVKSNSSHHHPSPFHTSELTPPPRLPPLFSFSLEMWAGQCKRA